MNNCKRGPKKPVLSRESRKCPLTHYESERHLRFNSLFIAGAAVLAQEARPTGQTVRRELQHILNTDPLFKPKWQFDWGQLNWDWVEHVADLLRNPLFILLILAFGMGIIFLLRRLAPYFQGAAGENRGGFGVNGFGGTEKSDGFNACYQEALRRAAVAEYREAAMALHKATVAYLFVHVIPATTGKTYTNNDIKRKLAGNHQLAPAFAVITTLAEIAGFSANTVKPADFQQALAAFKKCFLTDHRGRP
jgi:hypothetical protein